MSSGETLSDISRELRPGDRVRWKRRGRAGTVVSIISAGAPRLAIVWDGTRRDSEDAFDLVHRDGRAARRSPWATVELLDEEEKGNTVDWCDSCAEVLDLVGRALCMADEEVKP